MGNVVGAAVGSEVVGPEVVGTEVVGAEIGDTLGTEVGAEVDGESVVDGCVGTATIGSCWVYEVPAGMLAAVPGNSVVAFHAGAYSVWSSVQTVPSQPGLKGLPWLAVKVRNSVFRLTYPA